MSGIVANLVSSVQLKFTQDLAQARAGKVPGIQRRLRHGPTFRELTGWWGRWKVKNFSNESMLRRVRMLKDLKILELKGNR